MRLVHAPEVVHDTVEDRAVLVDPAGQELITLNPTGSTIWHALDGQHDDEALADLLHAANPDVERDTILTDVRSFLGVLLDEGLAVRAD